MEDFGVAVPPTAARLPDGARAMLAREVKVPWWELEDVLELAEKMGWEVLS